jgi:hypothetical protein
LYRRGCGNGLALGQDALILDAGELDDAEPSLAYIRRSSAINGLQFVLPKNLIMRIIRKIINYNESSAAHARSFT